MRKLKQIRLPKHYLEALLAEYNQGNYAPGKEVLKGCGDTVVLKDLPTTLLRVQIVYEEIEEN